MVLLLSDLDCQYSDSGITIENYVPYLTNTKTLATTQLARLKRSQRL